jgi:prephenate dehydrogenase
MDKSVIKVAIIGLNRLSASMGLALHAHNKESDAKVRFEITGQDAESGLMKQAQAIGAIDATNANARSAANHADMVIMSLPLGVRDDVFEYLAQKLKPGAVVLDMSTSKTPLIELAKDCLPRGADGKPQAYLVGVRPIVNNAHLFVAQNDLDTASADMFAGGEMIIAPDASVPQEAVKLASDLAEILLMTPHFMQPDEYDAIAGFTEDLPALLGIALFATMRASHGVDDLERSVNPAMAVLFAGLQGVISQDLITQWTTQGDYTQQRLEELITMLRHLQDLLAQDDAEQFFREIVPQFDIWLERRRRGKWESRGPDMSQIRSASMFGNLLGMGTRKSGKK